MRTDEHDPQLRETVINALETITVSASDSHQSLAAVHHRMSDPNEVQQFASWAPPRHVQSRSSLFRWGAVASAMSVIVTSFLYTTRNTTNDVSVVYAGSATIYQTQPGQRALVALADGSRITLGPLSRLRVNALDTERHREVALEGEAYFEVAPQFNAPFTVMASGTITRVLGTAFAIRADPHNPNVQVVVASGRVSFGTRHGPAENSTILTSAMIGTIGPDGKPMVQRGVDITPYLGWTEGHLTFENASVHEVLETLGRWYGIQFEMRDTIERHKLVDATFDASETESQVIRSIGHMLGRRPERRGTVVILHKE